MTSMSAYVNAEHLSKLEDVLDTLGDLTQHPSVLPAERDQISHVRFIIEEIIEGAR